MSRAGERSLQFGLNVANQISSPIMDALKERRQRDQAVQDQSTQLKNALLLHAATNPEIGQSLVNADQVSQENSPRLLNIGGQLIDPQKLDQLTKQHEAEQLANQLKIAQVRADSSPQNQFIIDPVTGAVSLGNKRTGEVAPSTQAGSQFSTTPQASLTELVDPNTGNKYKVKVDKAGNILPGEQMPSEIQKGTVIQDPVTGAVSTVNPVLPKGVGAGQAVPVTTGQSSQSEPKPFSISPKPNPLTQVSDSTAQKIGAYDSLLNQYKQIQDAYDKAPESIGPAAGKMSELKTRLGGIGPIPQNTAPQADLLSKVNSVRAEQVHQKYGGALSPQELNFANQFILNQNNPSTTFKSNLNSAINTIQAQKDALLKAEQNRGANIDKFKAQDWEGAPHYTSMEAAYKAAPKDGTPIYVDGKRATFHPLTQ